MFEVATLKRYLLGRLDPEAETQIEERLFVGDSATEEKFSAAEDELINDWAWKILNWKERRRFLRRFAWTPERAEKLRFATGFKRYVQWHERQQARQELKRRFSWLWDWTPAPALSFAKAAMAMVVVVGGAWLIADRVQLERRLDQLTADRAALEERLSAIRGSESIAAVSSAVATVWLTPGILSRGLDEIERVTRTAGPGLVRLQLDLGFDDYGSYRAALRDESGSEIWSQSGLRATMIDEKVAVTLTLPTEILPLGGGQIKLSGVSSSGDLELVGRYHFRVLDEEGVK